tara:strand:+ start:1368 stop:1562 length:195 start_codon:yes stop_codon:yes gene_type:complete
MTSYDVDPTKSVNQNNCARCDGTLEHVIEQGQDVVNFCKKCLDAGFLDWVENPPGFKAKYKYLN